MAKHLEAEGDFIEKRDPEAPYGRKKDGSPKAMPGRKQINVKPMTPDVAHAGPPLRRNNPRPPPRQQPREMAREPDRQQSSVVLGRNGEELARRQTDNRGDIFERVTAPPGWDYQWQAVTHHNKELSEIHQEMALGFYENGWRPVPASRHPGIWTPPGFEGAIVVRGLRLEERPLVLSKQAKAEDEARAKSQLRDQTDSLRLTQSQLPGANAGRAKAASGMKMTIDKSFELPPDENYDYGDDV